MRVWWVLLLPSVLLGQVREAGSTPAPEPLPQGLRLYQNPLTPQEMVQAMLGQAGAHQAQPGPTVEVVGYDEEALLKLLALEVARQVRLEFQADDKLQALELYACMHQDPSHPSPILALPLFAVGPIANQ